MDSYTVKFSTQSSEQVSVAIKDSINVAGFSTQLGSLACADVRPVLEDAEVTALLKQAGYAIAGKTVMHELAYGMTGVNETYGTPINPKFPNLIPGGSSSGSATAVANGEVTVAIGTDTGGSVRLPASCCGVYGIKPTFGLVSRNGVWPTKSTLDCVGAFANTAEQITEVMTAIAPDFTPITLYEENVQLGWLNVDANDVIIKTIKQALSKDKKVRFHNVTLSEFDNAFHAGMTIINRETWLACEDFYNTGKLGKDVAERLERASHTINEAVDEAEQTRMRFTRQVDDALENVDALVLPTLPHCPMTREDALAGKTDLTISKLVRPFNLSGHPAITIPCPNDANMPIGIQLVGRKGDDAFICALAESIGKSIKSQTGA